jgi:hypothetical protein
VYLIPPNPTIKPPRAQPAELNVQLQTTWWNRKMNLDEITFGSENGVGVGGINDVTKYKNFMMKTTSTSMSEHLSAAAATTSADNVTYSNASSVCELTISYLQIEQYCYIFIMCPLAFIGIVLNLISLKVFINKSFNTVTFKYIRLITLTDFFICIIIIPYCLTMYTQPFNKYDLFGRHFYLAYFYMPGANFAINISMLLNLLVTIERYNYFNS